MRYFLAGIPAIVGLSFLSIRLVQYHHRRQRFQDACRAAAARYRREHPDIAALLRDLRKEAEANKLRR
jgi:hypothetical protein